MEEGGLVWWILFSFTLCWHSFFPRLWYSGWKSDRQWRNGPYLRVEKSYSTFWGSPLSIDILSWNRLTSSTVGWGRQGFSALFNLIVWLPQTRKKQRHGQAGAVSYQACLKRVETLTWKDKTSSQIKRIQLTSRHRLLQTLQCSALKVHCQVPWYQGTEPTNAHIEPFDELATHSGEGPTFAHCVPST